VLRRVPVGATSFLFHYNELPSHVQSRVPRATLQRIRESRVAAAVNDGDKERDIANGNNHVDAIGGERSTQHARVNVPDHSSSSYSPPELSSSSVEGPGDPAGGFDARRLLVLHEPHFVPSEATLFALYRRAVKEREAIRRAQQEHSGDSYEEFDVAGDRSGDLRYLRDLEEPCLLLPDTRASAVSLGLTTNRATALHLSASNDAALPTAGQKKPTDKSAAVTATQLDDFHLGLVTKCDDYRVDYTPLPHHYVLGVPTALLRELAQVDRSGGGARRVSGEAADAEDEWLLTRPRRVPVDLSRWVVYDTATAQFLLRCRRRDGDVAITDGPSHASPTTRVVSSAPTYLALLEEQVFLAHTYSFDPKTAYDAARAAVHGRSSHIARSGFAARSGDGDSGGGGSTMACGVSADAVPSCGYTFFFFHFARIQQRSFSGSAQNAGVLYPSCFYSYTTEVQTTAVLAAGLMEERGHHCMDPQRAASTAVPTWLSRPQRGFAESPALHAATSFFIPTSGKRFHAAAAAAAGGDSPAVTSWTTQTGGYARHTWSGTSSLPSSSDDSNARGEKSVSAAATGLTRLDADSDEDGIAEATKEQMRVHIGNEFREWKGVVTARVVAATASLHRGTASHDSCSSAAASTADGTPLSFPSEGAAPAYRGLRSLEDCLDAERATLAESVAQDGSLFESWERGWRCLTVPIAVAMPLMYEPMMSLRPSGLPPDASVTDAPLAEALWRVLYIPETALNKDAARRTSTSGRATPSQAASVGGGAVLPLAEDRLATARYRVLLPFLCSPRRVLPEAVQESSPPVASRGEAAYASRGGRRGGRCCPALWHLDEVEAVCGWRRYRAEFVEPFGSFSGLLNHDLYITLGSHIPAFALSPLTTWGSHGTWRSPVVWINDDNYVRRVLLPNMQTFASNTSEVQTDTNLYVYRGIVGVLEGHTAALASGHGDALGTPSPHTRPAAGRPQRQSFFLTDEAVAAGAHHRMLVTALLQLQRSPPEQLRAWLAAPPDDPNSNRSFSQRTGVSEAYLALFKGNAKRKAAALSHSQLSCAAVVDALLSFTAADLYAIPLLDFLIWASLCSDFSPASLKELRCHAAAARLAFTTRDYMMAAKYCAQYPSWLCVDGGGGSTVVFMG
jgi:hypothetical protein